MSKTRKGRGPSGPRSTSSQGSLNTGLGQSGQTGAGLSGVSIFQFGVGARQNRQRLAAKKEMLQQKWTQFALPSDGSQSPDESAEPAGGWPGGSDAGSHETEVRRGRRAGAPAATGSRSSRSLDASVMSSKEKDRVLLDDIQVTEQATTPATNLSQGDLKEPVALLEERVIPATAGPGSPATATWEGQAEQQNSPQDPNNGPWA